MTQSESGEIGLNQVIGIGIGVAVVAAIFSVIAMLNRRARIARKERPPQKTKLLRAPGYSLQSRIDELAEKWNDAVLQAVMAGSLLGLLCSAIYPFLEGIVLQRFTFGELRTHPRFYIFLSLLALTVSASAWIIASVIRAIQLSREIGNYRLGLRGEQAVAGALMSREVAAAGYITFHDVPGDGAWNIDHVVVGPGGIFVLETKTCSRRKALRDQPEHVLQYDGQRLIFPWREDYEAVKQVEHNAKWVREFISDFAPEDIMVQPVLVVPGWFVENQGAYSTHAMNAEYLIKYIAKSRPRYAEHELQGVAARFEERCRDVEF